MKMMDKALLLGIDVGTSGCKTVLADPGGGILAAHTVEYPLHTPQPGWTEQDPEDWWQAAVQGIQAVLARTGVPAAHIAGIGLSGQMHGMVALDADGRVVRRAILWNDQRTAAQCREIVERAGGPEALLAMTNNLMLPGYTGGKILWMRQNEPDNMERTRMILNPKDYLRFRLTGEYATEVSDASGTGLFDVRNRRWSLPLLELLGISASLLPAAAESTDVTGTVSQTAASETGLQAGTPVVGGGGDAIVQTTGMGIIQPGVLGITVGTSGVAAMGLDGFKPNHGGRLQVFCNNAPHLWHAMGVTISAGGALQWYKNRLCAAEIAQAKAEQADVYAILDRQAEAVPPGSRRLLFLPYLNGERCPYADPDAKGAFIGLTLQHGKGEMTRAVMEGVQYSLHQVFDLFTRLDPAIQASRIIMSGGGSRSAVWRQICADIFQATVQTVSGSGEGGAFGAALLAGVGVGLSGSLEEAVRSLQIETVTEPNAGQRDLYAHLYGIYASLYPALAESFRQLGA